MSYANIREIIGELIGQRVVDITQHDQEDWREDGASFVCFHFEGGGTVTFPITDGGFKHDGLEQDLDEDDGQEDDDAEY